MSHEKLRARLNDPAFRRGLETAIIRLELMDYDYYNRRIASLEARLAWALEECDVDEHVIAHHLGLGRRPRGRVWSKRRKP